MSIGLRILAQTFQSQFRKREGGQRHGLSGIRDARAKLAGLQFAHDPRGDGQNSWYKWIARAGSGL
jgi:hypothetical protein